MYKLVTYVIICLKREVGTVYKMGCSLKSCNFQDLFIWLTFTVA